ncbi:MAG: hypothetical protein JSR17_06695 [Proteobacteria bacterium]|nr:hypothetical protein [Pseudomonadota bacterium]
MRYRFFREHKYVSFMLTEFERQVAKTDFSSTVAVNALKEPLFALWELMKGHAAYEQEAIFSLLAKKGQTLHQEVEQDHLQHEKYFQEFMQGLENIIKEENKNNRIELGYIFYLSYRFFVADNLRHLHLEEALIMPALQKLYTDEELSKVEAHTYEHMSATQMVQMMEHLFPQMDINDKIFFLEDIKKTQPDKFKEAYKGIVYLLTDEEKATVNAYFSKTELALSC